MIKSMNTENQAYFLMGDRSYVKLYYIHIPHCICIMCI